MRGFSSDSGTLGALNSSALTDINATPEAGWTLLPPTSKRLL